jgi:hypothetical protein
MLRSQVVLCHNVTVNDYFMVLKFLRYYFLSLKVEDNGGTKGKTHNKQITNMDNKHHKNKNEGS